MSEVTRILDQIQQGDPHAAGQLLPLVYGELRRLAAQKLTQEKPGQTLQATALVHEAYLRLVVMPANPGRESEGASPGRESGESPSANAGGSPRWDNRRHFFAAAAEAMRRILVENARRKQTHKHGGGRQRRELDEALAAPAPNVDLLALDAALDRLAAFDPLKAKLVELRYFAGLTGEQAAAALGMSASSADRLWVYTRAWLRRELGFGAES